MDRRYQGLRKRYQDGVLTGEPLWPWPMNQRIKNAMMASGRSPVDVTQTVTRIFGPIPQRCLRSNSNSSVGAPANLRITQ